MEKQIRLIHGDCRDHVFQGDDYIFVSDPPFNIGYHYDGFSDRMPEDLYYRFLSDVFRGSRHVIVHYPEQMHRYSIAVSEAPKKVVSWVYNSNTARQHRSVGFYGVMPDFRKVGQPYKNPNDKRIAKRIAEGKMARLYDWWNVNQVKNVSRDKTGHPCQMPLEVMMNIVGILPDDAIIVDPFMGSGTTGVACKALGRRFIGIENQMNYFLMAKDRIDNFTP